MSGEIKDRFLRCRLPVASSDLCQELLEKDVQRYMELALELGVSTAIPVNNQMMLLDPRSTLKCRIPRCPNYGTCATCPPYTPGLEEIKQIVNRYRVGILLRWDFPREVALNIPSKEKQSIYRTLSQLEAAAFYDGYYFCCGFGGGTCRRAFCHDKECQALADPLKGCRFPLLARPSMEGCGFDVYGMAKQAGWPLHPAGRHCPEEVETLYRIGLILIA